MSADLAVATPADTVAAPFADRLALLADATAAGADVVVIAPGADLQYFAGRSVPSHERLTALVVPAAGGPRLLVPALERGRLVRQPGRNDGRPIATWRDGDDPYRTLARLFPAGIHTVAVDYHMPAVHALGIAAAFPGSVLTLAGEIIAELRMRKEPFEVFALQEIGAAIDRVHGRIGEWLFAGRTERAVAADIAAALLQEGHTRADFVIVGSGPNGASPHHEASDKVIEPGEAVVIDIGGPGPTGYYSDCTRTYLVAGDSRDPEFESVYEVVRCAQQAGVDAVRPGVQAQAVDHACRQVIEQAGFGPHFITRTGHGIGLEVHEHPYVVTGNDRPLEAGMAFSIEPGIYLPGRFGVRIEDIVVVGERGAVLMNGATKALTTVGRS